MNLKEYLKENKIMLVDAARILNITYNHLHLIMVGKRNPSEALANEIVKLCKGKIKYEDIRIVKMRAKRKVNQDLLV